MPGAVGRVAMNTAKVFDLSYGPTAINHKGGT